MVNPEPATVRVKAGPPDETVDGEMLVSVTELEMVKGSDAGCGCPVTLTEAIPTVASSGAGTSAVSCVEETKAVLNGEPFHVTKVPAPALGEENPDPYTVSDKAGLPADAELGDRLVKVIGVCVTVTEMVRVFETRFPFCAVMEADACCAIRFGGTVVVIRFAFTTIVGSANPFQRMVVPGAKPVPVTVSVNAAPPAGTDDGEVLVIVRLALMVKESGAGDT